MKTKPAINSDDLFAKDNNPNVIRANLMSAPADYQLNPYDEIKMPTSKIYPAKVCIPRSGHLPASSVVIPMKGEKLVGGFNECITSFMKDKKLDKLSDIEGYMVVTHHIVNKHRITSFSFMLRSECKGFIVEPYYLPLKADFESDELDINKGTSLYSQIETVFTAQDPTGTDTDDMKWSVINSDDEFPAIAKNHGKVTDPAVGGDGGVYIGLKIIKVPTGCDKLPDIEFHTGIFDTCHNHAEPL